MSAPSLVTTTATLTPSQMNGFFDKMDRLGLAYLFTLNGVEQTSSGVEHSLVCMVDGADIAGFTIVLRSDGTWKALVDVIVGEGVAA